VCLPGRGSVARELGAHVLEFLSLHDAKGVACMSEIKRLPPLPTTCTVFIAATGDASRLRCCELAEQKGCR
jgi:hypothetical protein